MSYIEPHAHMVSRSTDDYQAMAIAGCAAICEPAFWAGYDRVSAQGFYDYYRQLTDYEPKRAAKFGIPHFCWLCINPKEAEDAVFAREVMALIPEFLDQPTVLGIGEIGMNKNTRNELAIFEEHVDLALQHDLPILIHTPHLEDKLKGTRLTIDALNNAGANPDRVIIDHVEEHTAGLVLDAGFWAGMTLYPESKCSLPRAIDILETFGMERIWMNSACDWGVSDPLAVAKCMQEMKRRQHLEATITKVAFDNPKAFLSQSPNFRI
jgi:predicted metal-dependent TIM-barrel fold hydrolase